MKYEILDKDTQGVIVGNDGKLYRIEFPSREVRTIGMTVSKVVDYVDWQVGEEIEYMVDVPIDEYIEPCNEVDQCITVQGKICYYYKHARVSSLDLTGVWGAISGYMGGNIVVNKCVFNIDSQTILKI